MSGQIVITDAQPTQKLPKVCPEHPKVEAVTVNLAGDRVCPKCRRELEAEA